MHSPGFTANFSHLPSLIRRPERKNQNQKLNHLRSFTAATLTEDPVMLDCVGPWRKTRNAHWPGASHTGGEAGTSHNPPPPINTTIYLLM